METLHTLGGIINASWEVLCFALIAGIYAYLGRRKSVLQVTFIFTFYWGFNNLMGILTRSSTDPQGVVLLYVGCGLAIFGLMSASYLLKKNNLVDSPL